MATSSFATGRPSDSTLSDRCPNCDLQARCLERVAAQKLIQAGQSSPNSPPKPSTTSYSWYQQPVLQRPPEPEQYVSKQFAELCESLGVTRSRGAVGTRADNAAAEAFNASLKRETLQGARAARLAVFRWATRYNTRRLHSALGHHSTIDCEH